MAVARTVVRIICSDLDCWEEVVFPTEGAAEIYALNANAYFDRLREFNPKAYTMRAIGPEAQRNEYLGPESV